MTACLVAIPAYGRDDLTTRLLGLLAAPAPGPPCRVETHVLVVDNRGDFPAPPGVEVVRPPRNLRWIGSANLAFERAVRDGYTTCAVLNNDIDVSAALIPWLALAFEDVRQLAIAGPFYNCYWPHQRKPLPAGGIDAYEPVRAYREVPFCDGTAIMVSTEAVGAVGCLDAETFSWHGYGSEVDFAIRARRAGMRAAATEGCYVIHQRRATIAAQVDDVERRVADEYQGGLQRKWGSRWREHAGLREPLVDPVLDRVALGAQIDSPRGTAALRPLSRDATAS